MNISVVIPMYNREKTIESAVRSVLEQTVQPMEIIIVDDCSTDKSVKIAGKIRKENEIVRLLCFKKNRGAQAARNCGIKAAKGEWILFLDSDDELPNNALEILAEAAGKNPGYDVYYGDHYRREGNKTRYINCRMKGKHGNYFHAILFSPKAFFGNSLVRKQALQDIGFLDEAVPAYQEWDTHIRLSVNHKYFYIHKPIWIYNIHDGETISKDGKRDIRGYKYVVRKNGNLFLQEGGIKSIIKYYEGMHFRCNSWKDYRQHYYLCMARFFQFVSSHNLMQDKFIKIIGSIWKFEGSRK